MEILVKPLITEKATAITEKSGRYSFVVNRNANKLEIKKAVEAMYSVTVERVNTMVAPGKAKSRNTKSKVVTGNTGRYKKAVVTLQSGNTIDFYSNI